jgi:hypothetical protein
MSVVTLRVPQQGGGFQVLNPQFGDRTNCGPGRASGTTHGPNYLGFTIWLYIIDNYVKVRQPNIK